MTVGQPGVIENASTMGGQGVFFALDYFLQQEKILETIDFDTPGLQNKTFIIQGLGKLGQALSIILERHGAVCVGIKEVNSFIYDNDGIDVTSAINQWKKHNTFDNFGKGKQGISDDIFKEPCDLLILAANSKSLVCYTADKVKANVIVEASNCAITPTSHRILVGHTKLVLPDIYACSGYSVASYFEYLLNNRKKSSVLRPLYQNILDSFSEMENSTKVVSTATTQKILTGRMNPSVLTYGLEHVMAETGNVCLFCY